MRDAQCITNAQNFALRKFAIIVDFLAVCTAFHPGNRCKKFLSCSAFPCSAPKPRVIKHHILTPMVQFSKLRIAYAPGIVNPNFSVFQNFFRKILKKVLIFLNFCCIVKAQGG